LGTGSPTSRPPSGDAGETVVTLSVMEPRLPRPEPTLGDVAVGEEPDASLASDGSCTPHWACAFWMTFVLSSRNINESWSR